LSLLTIDPMGRGRTLIFCLFFQWLSQVPGDEREFFDGGVVPLIANGVGRGVMIAVERIKGICLKPTIEWSRIETETRTTRDLLVGYVAPLAAIGPIASLIGGVVVGRTVPFVGTYRVPLASGLAIFVVTYAMSVVGTVVLSWIIKALAPSFGGRGNQVQAMKVAVFAYTPAWIAGLFMLFTALAPLVLVGGLYGLYLLYLGLPVLMKSPKEKAGQYTIVVVACAILLGVVFGAVTRAVGGLAAGSRLAESSASRPANLQPQAAMQGVGALFGDGRHVDPVGIEVLKPFVPDRFARMPRTGGRAEKNGPAGLAVSKAEATYGNRAEKHVTLEISDTGGISALVGMASWMNLQGERVDDQGFERTRKVDGRLVHEQGSRQPGGSSEFTVVLGDRFVVSARGRGVELADLETAVASLDLGKLEAEADAEAKR
jgi:Yip1 domain